MGIVDDSDDQQEMAAAVKPKERQFQVVPVPGVFTRGRWKCWDYKDNAAVSPQEQQNILDFESKDSKSNSPIFVQSPRLEEKTEEGNQCSNGHSALKSNTDCLYIDCTNERQRPLVVTSVANRPNMDRCLEMTASSRGVMMEDQQMTLVQTTSSPVLALDALPAAPFLHNPSNLPSLLSRSPQSLPNIFSVNSSAGIAGGANVVAIDNKIEQAMDLVKTHLTYAVREEVEVLRSTIVDLENKLSILEKENSVLRQVAPAEILVQLPYLIVAAQQVLNRQENDASLQQSPQP